jgi:hypothetical protein
MSHAVCCETSSTTCCAISRCRSTRTDSCSAAFTKRCVYLSTLLRVDESGRGNDAGAGVGRRHACAARARQRPRSLAPPRHSRRFGTRRASRMHVRLTARMLAQPPPRLCSRDELIEQLRQHVFNNFLKVFTDRLILF